MESVVDNGGERNKGIIGCGGEGEEAVGGGEGERNKVDCGDGIGKREVVRCGSGGGGKWEERKYGEGLNVTLGGVVELLLFLNMCNICTI